MTVAEMIAALQKMPQDATVVVNGGEGVNDDLVVAQAPKFQEHATVAHCEAPAYKLEFRRTRNVVWV